MNVHEKLSAPLRGAEHYNQVAPSTNVRKSLDTTHFRTRKQNNGQVATIVLRLVAYSFFGLSERVCAGAQNCHDRVDRMEKGVCFDAQYLKPQTA
jgi:hypothetical protein